jgi:hypothetical protein
MPPEADANSADFVTLYTFTSEPEASLAKGALEAFGINCMIAHDDCGGQRPHLAFTGGFRLVVRAMDAQTAAEVLNYRPERTSGPS